jgi:hypothetical protein
MDCPYCDRAFEPEWISLLRADAPSDDAFFLGRNRGWGRFAFARCQESDGGCGGVSVRAERLRPAGPTTAPGDVAETWIVYPPDDP